MRFLLITFILCWSHAAKASDTLTTIGWIETVRILPEGLELKAKIDTGADNSSLGAIDWQNFKRNGQKWIRFKLLKNNGGTESFERPLDRYALIKRKQTEALKRPVIKLWLCIGNKKLLVPVNLAKRKKFKYRILIGRSFLKRNFLVDSAKELTQPPTCSLPQ